MDLDPTPTKEALCFCLGFEGFLLLLLVRFVQRPIEPKIQWIHIDFLSFKDLP